MQPAILLTGFEPFGGATINPAAEVARVLAADPPSALRVSAQILPVASESAARQLTQLLAELRPQVVLLLGQAGGRSVISLERVAINLRDFRIPDNSGAQPVDLPVVADGPAAYFASLPLRRMLAAILSVGVPAELSLSAGSYICNEVMYRALHYCAVEQLPTRVGFIHLPSLPEQVTDRPGPSMALETMLCGLRAALNACCAAE